MNTIEYIVLTLANYTESQLSDIDKCCITSLALARKNNTSTKCILKVQTDSTGAYSSTISSLTKYSLSEIKDILNNDEWKALPGGDLIADWPGHNLEIET